MKRRSLNLKTLRLEQKPPMQHCNARPTNSSFKGKEAEEKETTKKNSVAKGEGEKWAGHPKHRRT
jgi:hypothetical protein